jgi:arylsulfatase A-like enzyme
MGGEVKRPNIVYVFADQMRSTAMGCAGVEPVCTPHLDAFAAEGTRFTNAVSNTPICSPSRATLITGLHPLSHGLVNNDVPLRTDVRGIAHCLNDAGYRCSYVGKWHMDCADRGAFIPPGPRRQGFDDAWAVANCNHAYQQAYYYRDDDPEPVWIDGYEPEAQADIAERVIRERAGGDPFCLFLSWGPPHCGYRDLPQRHLDRYPPESIRVPPEAADARVVGMDDGDGPTAEEDLHKRRIIGGYYAHVTALDACFGRVLAALREAGIEDETIVVFSSDHGDMLFNHNRGWKCKPWRESVGVPLIVRWPGRVPAGRVTNGPIGVVDHMPTLLGLADVPIPDAVEGVDCSAFAQGDDAAAPECQLIGMPVVMGRFSFREWRGVVTRAHTYARMRDRPWILYDDAADPRQTTNLAAAPERGELRDALEAVLQRELARTNDAFETSVQVADRLYPGHADLEMPYYENETIKAGRALRRKSTPRGQTP